MREVPLGLAHAYAQAVYVIRCDRARTVTVRVGHAWAPAAALLAAHGTPRAAIVTAANPFSQQLSRADNRLRRAALREALRALGAPHLGTLALDPLGCWPAERGFFVAGISDGTIDELLRSFEQFAAVTLDATGRAALRWHPDCIAPPLTPLPDACRSRGST